MTDEVKPAADNADPLKRPLKRKEVIGSIAIAIGAIVLLVIATHGQERTPGPPLRTLGNFTHKEAEELRREIVEAFYENSRVILREAGARPRHGRYLADLVARAETLYGDVLAPYGACTRLAVAAQSIWMDMLSVKLAADNGKPGADALTLYNTSMTAFGAGDDAATCRSLVTALASQKG